MLGNKEDTSGRTVRWLLLLLLLTILFMWKILLTRQFSLLVLEEDVRQTYSWLNFLVMSIKQGILPFWDPFTGAGSSFPGEMQTAPFFPLNLLLALIPLNRNGVLSPQSYHLLYAFIHYLGACFMFALVRALGISRFSALVAGICFSLGGFIIHASWPHMYESAIWLPLIFFLLIRALDARNLKRALLYASMSGLMLGLSVLAGGLHIVIMQVLIIITAAIFTIFHPQMQSAKFRSGSLTIPILVCATVLVVGFCAGAIQLFPSMEYSRQALRYIGSNAPALLAETKIPYAYLHDGMWPHAFLGMLISTAFGGSGEIISPYIGVFPLLASIIGIIKCWNNLWVRYLAGLAVVSFLYTLGEWSFFHGVLYAILPRLWMAREAGRFLYLTSFAMSILAAFGIDALLCKPVQKSAWRGLNQILTGIVILCASALMVPALLGHPEINLSASFSILMILSSYGLFQYIIRAQTGAPAQVLVVILVLFDLSAFYCAPRNIIDENRNGTINHLERLLSCRGAVNFLKSRPVPYRVRIDENPKPNIGHAFQIPTLQATGVTSLKAYDALSGSISNLLNVRYILKPSSATEPGALYQDNAWKIYENTNVYPAAWIVHETMIEPSVESLCSRINTQGIDFHRTAALSSPLEIALDPRTDGMPDSATFSVYNANRLELDVQAQSRGLMVLSEIYYPGWRVTVNGTKGKIYKVNGILRGIVVPRGRSHIIFQYAPMSIIVGGLLSLLAFSGTLLAFVFQWRKRNSSI